MTDGGLEVRRRVNALREKLRGSGCTIRGTEVEIADIDEPGTVYRSTDYVFDRKSLPAKRHTHRMDDRQDTA
jgi:hypothetical protein